MRREALYNVLTFEIAEKYRILDACAEAKAEAAAPLLLTFTPGRATEEHRKLHLFPRHPYKTLRQGSSEDKDG